MLKAHPWDLSIDNVHWLPLALDRNVKIDANWEDHSGEIFGL